MKFPKLKKWQWITIAVISILLITNPSLSTFKQYLGADKNDDVRKKSNFFLFSVYTYDYDKYLGVFGNFITIHTTEKYSTTEPKQYYVPPKESYRSAEEEEKINKILDSSLNAINHKKKS